MFDQMLEGFRKASESAMQAQKESFKYWTQQWFAPAPEAAFMSGDWGRTFQKKFVDLTLEFLNKQREAMDSAYRSGISVIEQTFRVSDVRSPEDYRHAVEDLWRKLFETFKAQSETQVREFQGVAEKFMEMARRGEVRQ